MGSGIAQVACLGGIETRLHDPLPEALSEGERRLRAGMEKGAERGRWSPEEADRGAGLLHPAPRLDDLAGCELVIEAAPENLATKRELFAALAEICGPDTVLATNTSSLSVAAIAAGSPNPQRVVGMHFFNPPALMKLVEVIAGPDSSDAALDLATEAAERMGRTPVRAADEIGFVGNRCARPYSLEALRLLGDRVADAPTIDRICRIGGGFRMGPFELMDFLDGVPLFKTVCDYLEAELGSRFKVPVWVKNYLRAGRTGRSCGKGFHDYTQK